MKSEQKFWYQWMAIYSIGELLGIGTAAIVTRFLFIEYSHTIYTASPALTALVLIFAGAIEGLIIGYVQWKSLSKLVIDFRPAPWIIVTTVTSIIGWLLILPPAVMIIFFFSQFSLLSTNHTILYTALAGLSFGGIIGVSQYFVMRNFFHRAVVWIFATAIGWSLSFLIVYIALSLFSSTFFNLFLIITACALSGLVQAIVSGTSLHLVLLTKKGYERSHVTM